MNKLFLTISLVFWLHLLAYSQSDSARLTTIAAKLQKFAATRPVEKVYLQFNKPGYNFVDTIWFKGYITVGQHHQPSALSGILYVELIDTKDKLLKSLQLKSVNGIATGDFELGDKLLPGEYHIRAYTNWMRNAGPDYFFNQAVSIGDIKANSVFIMPTVTVSNNQSVNTKLTYTDKLGRAYVKREVTYEVRADTNLLYKGKGLTDASGNLSFAFPGKTAPGQRVKVISHFKLVNGITIDKTIPIAIPDKNIDIQFFPEGGQLVNDVRSKIAFKAIGADGLGADVKGVVVDNDNNEVAYFNSQHAGMGVFALMPQKGKTYTAKVTLPGDSLVISKLPIAADKGFVLAVNSSDASMLNIRVATNAATLDEKHDATFYVVGQSGGVVYFTSAGKLNNASFNIAVPKNRFPSGIAQFTLFSNTNEPLNERVVFIRNNTDILNLNLSAPKTTFGVKEKVGLNFTAKDNTNKPVSGNFSLSVYNEDRLTENEDNESTILSNILLTSDLKGYIEEPNYYFKTNSDITQAKGYLDILMLTQGYRRFEWKEVMAGNYPTINYHPEKSLSISGRLTAANGKPVVNGDLKVLALANTTALDTKTDAEGKFNLPNVEFDDSTKLVIQARKANDGKNVNISIDNTHTVPVIFKSNMADMTENFLSPFLKMVNHANEGDGGVNPANQRADTTTIAAAIKANTINLGNHGKELKEVAIKAHIPDKPDQSNLWGSTRPEKIISGDRMREFAMTNMGLESSVDNILPKDGKIYDASPAVRNRAARKGVPLPPIPIVLNGSPVNVKADDIDAMVTADQIENVKILRGDEFKVIYGIPYEDPNDRIIFITTKQFAGTAGVGEKPDTLKNKGLKKVALNEVTIKSRKNAGTELNPWQATVTHSANLNGPGHADQVISAKDLADCLDLFDCMINKIPGIIHNGGNLYFAINMGKSITAPPPIMFMLDGVFTNADNLSSINVNDVETVEVLKSNSYLNVYGTAASGGLLIITSKFGTGVDDNAVLAFKDVPGVIYTKFNGFYKVKEFYTPKYTPANSTIADNRTAIYWNPNITTGDKGTFPIEFFNSDVKGTYRAVIEGIDNDGNIGRFVYRYKVE